MTAFDRFALAAFTASDAMFGEDFVVRPFALGADRRGPETPDPVRDTLRLSGVWRDKPADPKEPNAYDPREYRRPGTAGDAPFVEFSPAATAGLVKFDLRDGDHVERVATGVVYRARTPTLTPNGLMRVPLNRLGPA